LQFRPKNFLKPEVKAEQTVAHATVTSGPSDGNGRNLPSGKEKKSKDGPSSGRRRKQAPDEVTFGGGVCGALVVDSAPLYESCFPC